VEVRDGTHLETLKSALKSKGIQVH
jgi:hypothetical protein